MFKTSQPVASTMLQHSSNMFAPKLSIKLQENNFLLWNQQVEEVIFSHKLHKVIVNPQFPPMFKSVSERLSNIVSKDYEALMVLDQTLFTWLLSTISEAVLFPRILSCRPAHEVWDKVNKHFHLQIKAQVHQLMPELKTIKKGNMPISKHVLRITLQQKAHNTLDAKCI